MGLRRHLRINLLPCQAAEYLNM